MIQLKNSNTFSPKQIEILKFPYIPKKTILIADGAIRSGKTTPVIISFILWAMANFKNQNFGICSFSVSVAEKNIINPIENIDYFKQLFKVNYNGSERILYISKGNSTNKFYVYGGKDKSSFKNIQGSTLAGLLLDEVVLMPRNFVEQALGRCSVRGKKIFCTCNPDDPNHWFKKEYIDQQESKKVVYLQFGLDDNPSLDEETKAEYRSRYTGVFYQRNILGKWVKAEGIIYEDFADNPEKYIKHKSEIQDIINKISVIRIGVDFGGNKSKHSFTATGITHGFEHVVVLKAERVKGLLNPTQLEDEYYKFVLAVEREYQFSTLTRADNAEPVLIRGLINKVNTSTCRNVVKGAFKKPILGRILTTNRLCKQERFYIVKGEAIDLENALKGAVWNDKVPNERLDDGTCDIDSLDSFEYSFEEFDEKLNGYS